MKINVSHNGRQLLFHLDRVPQQVNTALAKNIERGALEVQRAQKDAAPKAQTILTNAIIANKIDPLTWEIVAATNYATAIEKGSDGGGVAPVQAILDWIKVKHIQPNDPDMDQEDLAFIFQRSIAKRGQKAQPFMQPALIAKQPRLKRLIAQALKQGLA